MSQEVESNAEEEFLSAAGVDMSQSHDTTALESTAENLIHENSAHEHSPDNNPQDATIPGDFPVLIHDDTPEAGEEPVSRTLEQKVAVQLIEDSAATTPASVSDKERDKRRRNARIPSVEEGARIEQGPTKPWYHFETVLVRKAIRKIEDIHQNSDEKEREDVNAKDEEGREIYGDTSVGMKLIILSNKVIVQELIPLADGRASPAQLVGIIKRGDMLLALNNLSLINLSFEPLMQRLKPLSTPDESGAFQRTLHLRFSAGEGLALLLKSEKDSAERVKEASPERVNEFFNLIPMVDQLSGRPFFEPTAVSESTNDVKEVTHQIEEPTKSTATIYPEESTKKRLFDDITISTHLHEERIYERRNYLSKYFAWNDECPGLLKLSSLPDPKQSPKVMTIHELMQFGRRATLGADSILRLVETLDRGSDNRRFQTWSSTLSMYSRASTRRRYVLDTASLPVNIKEIDQEDSISMDGSEASDDEGKVDGDELLLRLAAHDEIWRTQVKEFLKSVVDQMNQNDNDSLPEEDGAVADMDVVISNELGSFLFGESMNKLLKKHKQPQILPPQEATSVLFDLCTQVAATVPDEITTIAADVSYRSTLVPFIGMRRPAINSDAMLATRFLLDDALPLWLKTFRPLAWEHRRVLWPLERASTRTSTAASTLSEDSLTLDSMSTNQNLSPMSSTRQARFNRKPKNLRERIEDHQLDPETRAETCFLITYYFTQKLLPQLVAIPDSTNRADGDVKNTKEEEISIYVKEYGSYLKLHTCLAYAAILKAHALIEILLDVAQHDPKHKDASRQISKGGNLLFYEPPMLSAVVYHLHRLRIDTSSDHRQKVIGLCVSAYPDVRPWQVKSQCILPGDEHDSVEGSALADLYYTYLSLLLDPLDGHKAARNDPSLVEEWCRMSTEGWEDNERRKNFYKVASRTSSNHLAYTRDLKMLLQLSMSIEEYGLILDLGSEILDEPSYANDSETLHLLLSFLRDIAKGAVVEDSKGSIFATKQLKRIVRLYRKVRRCANNEFVFDLPSELYQILLHLMGTLERTEAEKRYLEFLVNEAEPGDFLQTLYLRTCSSDMKTEIIPLLRSALRRGVETSMETELSGSLLRLRKARLNLFETDENEGYDTTGSLENSEDTIWKRMSQGMLSISK